MSHFLTDEQLVMRDAVRQFVEEEVKPAAVDIDAQHAFPEQLWKRCADLGITGIMAPKELGGLGETATTEFMVMEEIGRGCPTLGLVLDVNYFTIGSLMDASEEQKQKWIPAIAKGEGIGGICSSDPTGSINFGEWPIMATKVEGGWEVTCTKVFQTTSMHSSVIIVDAMSDQGPLKLIVDMKEAEGIGTGHIEQKIGLNGSDTGTMTFDHVFVPDENLLVPTGPSGAGNVAFLDVSAICLGAAEEALEKTTAYLMQRTKAGKPIITLNGVNIELARLATEVELARDMVYTAGRMHDEGRDIGQISSMAKAWVPEMAVRTIQRCIELQGGVGYCDNKNMGRLLRDVIGLTVAEVSTQMHYAFVSLYMGVPDVIL